MWLYEVNFEELMPEVCFLGIIFACKMIMCIHKNKNMKEQKKINSKL